MLFIKYVLKKPLSFWANGFFAAFLSKKLDIIAFLAKIIDKAVLNAV